jgi:N-acetylneuraminic acid mutarotase
MKKTLITLIFLAAIFSAIAQSIVWNELAPLPEEYFCGEAVSLNKEIYFVAGRSDHAHNPYFYKFNPVKNKWVKLADIPKPTMNLAMVAVKDKIYAIGGDLFSNTNFEYSPETNTWKSLSPMPTARQHIDCGVYDDNVFIMGGLTSWKNITKKHEVYNITSNTWSEKASIPSLRNNAAVVTLDSIIYVIGGAGTEEDIWDDIWTVESYNVNSNKWVQKNDLPLLLFKPAAVVVNSQIIVLGGQTLINGKNDCSDKVLIYQPESDQWIETTPLPAKNVFFACASIGNKVYVIGGNDGAHPDWKSYNTVYEGTMVNEF